MIRLALIAALSVASAASLPAPAADAAEVFFSPHGGTAAAVIDRIHAATSTIDVAAYQMTSAPIAAALSVAAARGVAVRILLDRGQESTRNTYPAALCRGPVACRTDRQEKLFHNKWIIIDGSALLVGSYNWTANAEAKNAENLIVLTDPPIITAYASQFQIHWDHSQKWQRRPINTPLRGVDPRRNYLPRRRPILKGFLSWPA